MTAERIFDRDYIIHTLSERVTEEWNRTADSFPAFLPVTEEGERAENEKRIMEGVGRLKAQLDRFPYPFGFPGGRRRWRKTTERMLDEILFREPLLAIDRAISRDALGGFKDGITDFLSKVRAFAPELAMEDMGQAVRNYLVYAIFRELNGLPQKCTSAIFGYSMLYPYTDNFIDGDGRSQEEKNHFNRLIADKLSGNAYETVSDYEEKTARLLSAIEEDYDREDEIFDGLLLMLEAQKDSQRQEDDEEAVTQEQALAISVYKGGLSVLIDRYFINLPMTEKDLHFYYGFGFVLQLCDDLQDISQDRENGSRTVFSMSVSFEETEKKINRLFHYTKSLFDGCDCKEEAFKKFLFDNCCLLILFSAIGSREHVSEEWLKAAAGHLPVSAEYIDSLKAVLPAEDAGLQKKYGKMMDTFLKSGRVT